MALIERIAGMEGISTRLALQDSIEHSLPFGAVSTGERVTSIGNVGEEYLVIGLTHPNGDGREMQRFRVDVTAMTADEYDALG